MPPSRQPPSRQPPARQPAVAPPRRTSLTGRAAALALVFCLLAISLAYPLREYLSQRGEIGSLDTKVAAQKKRVAELERARKRWEDPSYVKAQARERLHFVMPGETQYVVLEPDEAPALTPVTGHPLRLQPERPWFSDLWQSVEAAGKG
jgi:cell division protein FtsB